MLRIHIVSWTILVSNVRTFDLMIENSTNYLQNRTYLSKISPQQLINEYVYLTYVLIAGCHSTNLDGKSNGRLGANSPINALSTSLQKRGRKANLHRRASNQLPILPPPPQGERANIDCFGKLHQTFLYLTKGFLIIVYRIPHTILLFGQNLNAGRPR